jgi:hypothetical protein
MRIAVRWALRSVKPSAALLALSAACWVEPTVAQPSTAAAAPSVELEWSGPGPEADCLGADRLVDAVDDYLGRSAFGVPPAEIALHVRVERTAQGWRALVQLAETASSRVLGERELVTRDPRCASLDEPLKLAVALLVDDEIAASPEKESPDPRQSANAAESERLDDPGSDADTDAETAPPSANREPLRVFADVTLLAQSGLLPGALPGAEVGLGILPASWLLLRVHAGGFAPRSVAAGTEEVRFALAYAGAALCPILHVDERWSFAVCAGGRFGALFANAGDLALGRDRRRQMLAASLGLRPSWQLTKRFSLFGNVEAVLPYHPERFMYDLDGERRVLFELESPAWLAGLGGAVTF